jgi:hypothetical protein
MCRDLLTWSIVQRASEARCMVLRILANVLPALCGDLCSQTCTVLRHLGLGVRTEVLVSTSCLHTMW